MNMSYELAVAEACQVEVAGAVEESGVEVNVKFKYYTINTQIAVYLVWFKILNQRVHCMPSRSV